MKSISLVIAAAVCALFPNVAFAKEPRGYQARLMRSGRVCLQARTDAEATRLGMPVGARQCRLPARWAQEGLRIEFRTPQPA